MILSLIDATNSAIEKLRAHRMPREQRKRLNLLIGRITVFTTGLFASYPTFEDILQSKAGSDHKAPWYTVWDCIGRIAGATGMSLQVPILVPPHH